VVLDPVREDPRRLNDRIYEEIRDRILSGRLQPEERLRQSPLAQEFGTSQTPGREALSRLASEGLVRLSPHRGAVVTTLSPSDIDDIYEVREALDPYAAKLTAERAADGQLAEVMRLAEKCSRESGRDARTRFENNRLFHRSLYVACGNSRLVATLDWLWDPFTALRMFEAYVAQTSDVARMNAEHLEIAAAAQARDGRRTATLVRRHVIAARRELVELVKEPSE
jgi:DNA-binding GntR family transcriptional regulator